MERGTDLNGTNGGDRGGGDEDALRISERDWTNGVTIRSVGLYSPGKDFVKQRIKGEWVVYPQDSLADKDRKELLALDLAE